MELHTIRGGSREELEAHRYNIGVGVSLGNKWFTSGNITESACWALRYTREFVVIYVADSIHAINLAVRNRISDERALRVATRMGQELITKVQSEISASLSPFEQSRILYAVWSDVTDDAYQKKVAYLYELYKLNQDFQTYVQNIVREQISRENRVFNETEVYKFGTYILEELPEVMGRVPIKNMIYEAYTYPIDGSLTRLAEKLQLGEVFPEIKANILDTEPKVFLEVR